jgi:hypothetical protein
MRLAAVQSKRKTVPARKKAESNAQADHSYRGSRPEPNSRGNISRAHSNREVSITP